MKSKESKINIDVNIFGTRFSVKVPFADQDAVRTTESEMKTYLKRLRDNHSQKSLAECLAMMAFHYASCYFSLAAKMEADTAQAEDLLYDCRRMLGDPTVDPEPGRLDFGEF